MVQYWELWQGECRQPSGRWSLTPQVPIWHFSQTFISLFLLLFNHPLRAILLQKHHLSPTFPHSSQRTADQSLESKPGALMGCGTWVMELWALRSPWQVWALGMSGLLGLLSHRASATAVIPSAPQWQAENQITWVLQAAGLPEPWNQMTWNNKYAWVAFPKKCHP